MLIAHRFRHVLEKVLQQPPETLAEMAELMPGVDSYLKVVKDRPKNNFRRFDDCAKDCPARHLCRVEKLFFGRS